MIADFPKVKKLVRDIIYNMVENEIKQNSPVLSMVNTTVLPEGDALGIIQPNGEHTVKPFDHYESGFTLTNDEKSQLSPNDLIGKFKESAHSMAEQMERGIFKSIAETLQGTENTITGHQSDIGNILLMSLEKLKVNFDNDERSKPKMPTVFTGTDLFQKIVEHDKNTSSDEKAKTQEKIEALLDKKYEEYMKDLESRTIID